MVDDVRPDRTPHGHIVAPRSGSVLAATGPEIERLLREREFFWLDLTDEDGTALETVSDVLGLDDRLVALASRYDERALFQERGEHVVFVLFGVARRRRVVEVHGIVSDRFVVTVHREACPFFGPLVDPDLEAPEPACDWVALVDRIVGLLVESFRAVLSQLDDEIDEIEDEMFANPDEKLLERLFRLKREVIEMRRVVVPQRDLFSRLASGVVRVRGLTAEGMYFRVTFDHLLRVSDLLDSYRDLLTGALDAYLSTVSNRTNTVTKQLAVIATIFLPLTFITGFFGQNFAFMQSRIQGRIAFLGLGIGIELAAVAIILLLFRKRRWI